MKRQSLLIVMLGLGGLGLALWISELGFGGVPFSIPTGQTDQDAVQVPHVTKASSSELAAQRRLGLERLSIPGHDSRGEDIDPSFLSTQIVGIVIDQFDAPVEGAQVIAREALDATYSTLDLGPEISGAIAARDETDVDGRFSLSVPRARPFDVVVTAQALASIKLSECFAGADLELRLLRGAGLAGFFTRASDGTPVEGVRVRVDHGPDQSQQAIALSDSTGWYELKNLAPGTVGVMVIPEGLVVPRWSEMRLDPGEQQRFDVPLMEGRSVSGQVRDAISGAGIAFAEVSAWSFLGTSVKADAAGFYTLNGLRESTRELSARAGGYGPMQKALRGNGTLLDFELLPGLRIVGRILDPRGSPMAGARVTVCAVTDVDGQHATDWKSGVTGDDGRFRLNDLRSDLPLTLFARAAKHASALQALPFPPNDQGLVDIGDVTMQAAALLTGRVQDGSGLDMEGVMVVLVGPREISVPGSLGVYTKRRETWTDSKGRFALADLDGGTYFLRLHSDDRAAREETLVLAPQAERHDNWILSSGRSVDVLVRDPDAHPIAGIAVWLTPQGTPGAQSLRATTDESGFCRFELASDESSTQRVYARPPEGEAWAPCISNDVSIDVASIELRFLRMDAYIAGRVIDSSGQAIAFAYILIDNGEAVLSQANGSFQIPVPANTAWTLEARRTEPLDFEMDSMTTEEHRFQRRILREGSVARLEEVLAGTQSVELKMEN